MTEQRVDRSSTDSGLLSPMWAGAGVQDMLSDEAWVAAMVEVEVALARVQARLGVIPPSAAAAIAHTAAGTQLDVSRIARLATGAANPVVVLVTEFTQAVAGNDPAAAEYVHRGGTSQDILDSAAMLLAGRTLDRVGSALLRVAAALAGLADLHRGTAMAGRTLTQHAAPITFGLKAAGWLTLALDALDRVQIVRAGLPVQLGGAAGTLAAYQAYAQAAGVRAPGHALALAAGVAAELGLAEPTGPWHTLRTPIADLGAVAVLVTGALGKFAVDVLGMSRTEVGEVAEPAAIGRGVSSAMPQKRNPVLATVLVAGARQVPAYALLLGQSLLAEDERAAGGWQAEWQPLREALRLTAGAATTAAELAEGLIVYPDRLAANLELTGGTIVAERLNVELAPLLGKAVAKKLLARISLQAAAGGKPFDELLAAAPETAGQFADDRTVRALLDPANYLGATDEIITRVLSRYQKVLDRPIVYRQEDR